jgi:hypothetical protein
MNLIAQVMRIALMKMIKDDICVYLGTLVALQGSMWKAPRDSSIGMVAPIPHTQMF